MSKKILSLDQSTKKTGWALFVDGELQTYGLIDVGDASNVVARMSEMHYEIESLITKLNPNFVVIEGVQFQRNKQTFSTLSQMQGVIFGLLFRLDIGFCIMEPSAWKSRCGIKGKGREAQKKETIEFVKYKYKKNVSEDIADAIGIGCGYFKNLEG